MEKGTAPRTRVPASTHLLDRGPDRKLTLGWVKIVVNIRTQALLTAIEKSMFGCFAILFRIRARSAAIFGTGVLLRDGISRSNVSKRIKQIFLRRRFRYRQILP
jgi:hypothetical protein